MGKKREGERGRSTVARGPGGLMALSALGTLHPKRGLERSRERLEVVGSKEDRRGDIIRPVKRKK